jgi:hypothetical protein
MPCENVTESIRIELCPDGRLKSYSLRKLTCGVSIGAESMLIDQVHGRTILEIMTMDPAVFRTENAFNINKFLRLKHLIALKMALEAYTGQSSGAVSSACKIAEINYDKSGVIIDADIEVDIMVDKIKACGPCDSGCENQ